MEYSEMKSIAALYRKEILDGNRKKAADFLELLAGISEGNWNSYVRENTGVYYGDRFEKVKELRG